MRYSIIIPSYNRENELTHCLTSLTTLDFPRDGLEVIVVDDGSAQPLWKTTQLFKDQLPLETLMQKNAGPSAARNFGAKHARGELLAFLDDDCAPHRDWLKQLDVVVGRNPGSLVGGKTMNGCRDNCFAEINQKLLDSVIGWFSEDRNPLQFFASNNFVVPAFEFHEIGGFDTGFKLAGGEDRDFCARWLGSGRRLVSAPQACIDHFHPQTMRSYLHMHFRYGRGATRLHQSQRTSPARFARMGLYSYLFREVTRGDRGFSACMLVLLAQLATAVGYFYEGLRLPYVRQSQTAATYRG